MFSTMLEGQWRQLRGKIKEQWGELTDDDLDRANGKYDQMVGLLQERYGDSKADAESRLSGVVDSIVAQV